ncbi:MAG TPA: metallophosphoesterase [Bryobacteraceae bacterium]|nr:metallophosphoesterase [Bryobacteraceae bacterium]
MKLLVFSDIHGDLQALERILAIDADAYVAAGDLTSWGEGLDRCARVLHSLGEKLWVLPGNHESDVQVASICERYGFHDFHGRTMRAGGYEVAGLGYSTPTPFDTPGEYEESEMARRLAAFAGLRPLVLICHCPPYGGALDRIRDGLHGGSTAVRDFLEAEQPEWFFCGHIHEAAGVQAEMGKTRCANVGKRGYLLELE